MKNQSLIQSIFRFARRTSAAAFGLALLLAMLAVGCNKDSGSANSGGAASTTEKKREVHKAPDGAPLKLAFVTNNSSAFWNIAQKGLEKYEQENKVKVDLKLPNGTVQDQNRILDDLVTNGYNGIAVSPISPDDQTRELNKIAESANLICMDSDAAKSNRLAYIGTVNYEAGKVLGEEIVKLMPEGGKIAVFVGTLSADNARQRLKGVEDVVTPHKISVAVKKEDNKDSKKARSNVDDVINAQPDVKMMVGLWSYNGPQIAAAIDQAGKKGKVLAAVFDEESGTLDAIESGIISCTVVQKPFEFGYRSAKLLHELATKGESALSKDEIMDTGVTVINSANVKDFRTKLAELTK